MDNLTFQHNDAPPAPPIWHTGVAQRRDASGPEDTAVATAAAAATPARPCGLSPVPEDASGRKYRVTKGYDPYDFGNAEHATSFSGIVTHIIVISFGPTLLSIPASFVGVGYVTGFVGTVVTVFLYAYCMRMVVACEYELCQRGRIPNMSYIGMMREAFNEGPACLHWCSKYVELIIYGVFLCIWIGGNSIVFLLASQNLKNAYDYFAAADADVRLVMVSIVVPLVLLCWIPDLRLLVPVSFFTNVVNVFSIAVITYHAVQHLPPLAERSPSGSVTSVPIFVGLLLFTINATGLMIPLKNEMKRPKRFNSKFGVITVSYVCVTLMYSIFGLLCYVKYGNNAMSSVIMNLPETKFCKIVIGLYGVGNCCFFPLISYVSYDIIWNNVLKSKFEKSDYQTHYDYLCRTLIALSSMVFAYAIPNLALFLSLTGTVGTSIDSLIVPALAETLIYSKQRRYFMYAKNGLIMAIGTALILAGCVDFASQLVQSL